MLNSLDITPDDPEELRSVNRLLADEVKALSLKVAQLQHQLHGHNRHRFGSKSEGLEQLNLTFAEDEEICKAAVDQTKPATEPDEDQTPRQHSRKPCRIIWFDMTKCCRRAMIVAAAVVISKHWAKM